jgi:hypothetical protein
VETVPPAVEEVFQKSYRDAVSAVVEDLQVSAAEQDRLKLISRGLSLSAEVVQRAHVLGFLEGFGRLIADGHLSAPEEAQLAALRTDLNVPEPLVHAQLAKADQLRRARQVEEAAELTPTDATIALKKGEQVFYSTSVTERKSRVAQSYVSGGVRYAEREMEPVRSGSLYVTSGRLLLVAEGTTTIKVDRILDLTIEPERGSETLAVTVDGRKTPYYLEVPEPFLLAAFIRRVAASL